MAAGWAVATPHHLATEAAARAFERGGSAIDAALAAATTLAVVYPHQCGLGGDAIALFRPAGSDSVVVNGSGAAAGEASADELRSLHGWMPVTGPHTVTVPGAIAAWGELHKRGGRLPWASAFEAAIAHAEEGVPVAPDLGRALEAGAEFFGRDPGIAEVHFCEGRPLGVGDALRQPALARSLSELQQLGPDHFYRGDLGVRWIRGVRERGVPLTLDDLGAHASEVTEPLAGSFDGAEVLTAPPNSQGFLLLEVLAALELVDPQLDPLGPEALALAALFRQVQDDRHRLADPRSVPVPVEDMLSTARASQRARAAGGEGSSTAPNRPTSADGDTVAIVAIDGQGSAVSLIQSLFHAFGAGILEPETGIVCHNRGAAFSLDPAAPNALAPEKRPAHTLTPVMVQRGGRLEVVLGTMGGWAQPQILTQVLLHLWRGGSPQEAVDAPRWTIEGAEADSDLVAAEGDVSDPVRRAFASRPETTVVDVDQLGHAQLIVVPDGATPIPAADGRSDGAAAAGSA